jgi:hypothetical protein
VQIMSCTVVVYYNWSHPSHVEKVERAASRASFTPSDTRSSATPAAQAPLRPTAPVAVAPVARCLSTYSLDCITAQHSDSLDIGIVLLFAPCCEYYLTSSTHQSRC